MILKKKHLCLKLIPLCCVLAVSAWSCGGSSLKKAGRIVFSVGDVRIVKADKTTVPAVLMHTIGPGDAITTGKQSEAVIQIGSLGIVRVLPGTELSFDAIMDRAKGTELNLSKGSVFSKILKDNKYHVKNPTATASIRGTEFLVVYHTRDAVVMMHRGKVAVIPVTAAGGEVMVDAGRAAKARAGREVIIERLSGVDRLRLEKLSVPQYLEKPERMNEKDLRALYEEYGKKEGEIQKRIDEELEKWNRLSPVDKLRALGKPLSMLTMRDGSVLIGAVVSQDGRKVFLDTGEGIIEIPKNDIVRRQMTK